MDSPTPPVAAPERERWFSFDGESFETHETEAAARAEAEDAMRCWADDACDNGWNDCATQVCYGRVTHAVRVEEIDPHEGNRYVLPPGCEEHHLEPIAPAPEPGKLSEERSPRDEYYAYADYGFTPAQLHAQIALLWKAMPDLQGVQDRSVMELAAERLSRAVAPLHPPLKHLLDGGATFVDQGGSGPLSQFPESVQAIIRQWWDAAAQLAARDQTIERLTAERDALAVDFGRMRGLKIEAEAQLATARLEYDRMAAKGTDAAAERDRLREAVIMAMQWQDGGALCPDLADVQRVQRAALAAARQTTTEEPA